MCKLRTLCLQEYGLKACDIKSFSWSQFIFLFISVVVEAALPFKDQCVKWHNEYRIKHQVNNKVKSYDVITL